jgi:hypothetical protein
MTERVGQKLSLETILSHLETQHVEEDDCAAAGGGFPFF